MILGYEANIGLINYGPKWSWAEMVIGRNGHGPKWLWAEMTRNRNKLQFHGHHSNFCGGGLVQWLGRQISDQVPDSSPGRSAVRCD